MSKYITTGKYDPRNPAKEMMKRVDSSHPSHDKFRRTYVLLSIETTDGKIYFIINGITSADSHEELQEDGIYFYEESTCPTNFINIPMICANGDTDPHGLFGFEEAIWQVGDFDNNHEYFLKVFPQLSQDVRL